MKIVDIDLTGFEEGSVRGVYSEVWEDDGSAAFVRVYDRVQREGAFMEKAD